MVRCFGAGEANPRPNACPGYGRSPLPSLRPSPRPSPRQPGGTHLAPKRAQLRRRGAEGGQLLPQRGQLIRLPRTLLQQREAQRRRLFCGAEGRGPQGSVGRGLGLS